MRFSDLHHVNAAVEREIRWMGGNPYVWTAGPHQAYKTVADVIEEIRARFGNMAAASVRITVH